MWMGKATPCKVFPYRNVLIPIQWSKVCGELRINDDRLMQKVRLVTRTIQLQMTRLILFVEIVCMPEPATISAVEMRWRMSNPRQVHMLFASKIRLRSLEYHIRHLLKSQHTFLTRCMVPHVRENVIICVRIMKEFLECFISCRCPLRVGYAYEAPKAAIANLKDTMVCRTWILYIVRRAFR